MKKYPIITIIVLILGIPSTIYTSIQIIDWLSKNDSKIEIYYKIDRSPLLLPSGILSDIHSLTYEDRKKGIIRNVKQRLKQSIPTESKEVNDLIFSIIDGLTSHKVFGFNARLKSVWEIDIKNAGTKIARNLNILLPSSGYVEIDEEGKPTVIKEDVRKLSFTEVLPDTEIYIRYWVSAFDVFDKKIKASYNNGVPKIIKRNVYRTEDKYVFEFDKVLFKFYVIMFFAFLLAIVSAVVDKISPKATKKLDE